MLPAFLLPETEVRESGSGPALELRPGDPATHPFQTLLITLGITHILEQESLDVVIQGSADGIDWDTKPLLAFPQKFYCGTYQLLLDLQTRPGIRFLRPKWTVNRWGRGDLRPLFGIYVFAQRQEPMVAMVKGAA